MSKFDSELAIIAVGVFAVGVVAKILFMFF